MKSRYRFFTMTLCLLLLAGPIGLLTGAGKAAAQEMRVAVVKSISGKVSVLKSGGSKPFNAFKNMSLNEGDQISTGKNASVHLELASDKAEQDNVTIGPNSQVTFSKLDESHGKKTKMSIWAGSLWLKVKSVSNANDQFEVETPTSIMGVRGTHFYISVDPATGLDRLMLTAGVVESVSSANRYDSTEKEKQSRDIFIYPAQQLVESPIEDGIRTSLSVVNLDDIVSNAPPEIIKQIVQDAPSIAAEQQAYIDRLKEQMEQNGENPGELHAITLGDLDRITENLNNLVTILAKKAVELGKTSEQEMRELADQVNAGAGKKLVDLDSTAQLTLTKEDLLSLSQAQNHIGDQNKLADDRKKQQEQKESEQKDYLDSLNKQKQSLQQQNDETIASGQHSAGGTEQTGSSNSGSSSSPAPSVGVTYSGNASTASTQLKLDLNVNLGGFSGTRTIYGYQVKAEYDAPLASFNSSLFSSPSDMLAYRGGGGLFKVEPAGTSVDGADSVDDVRINESGAGSSVVYSVTKFSGSAVAVSGSTTVVKLPFIVTRPETAAGASTIPVKFRFTITAIDENGDTITTASGQDLTVNVTFTN